MYLKKPENRNMSICQSELEKDIYLMCVANGTVDIQRG